MLTVGMVREAIKDVQDPELGRSLVDLGMVKEISVQDGNVDITLALTTLECPMKQKMAEDLRAAVQRLPEVKAVEIHNKEMSSTEKAQLLGGQVQCPAHAQSNVKQVVAVMSGKGGVGKSAVTALLAVSLARKGFRVGILDTDITGPSIPKMLGLHDRPGSSDKALLPVISSLGIKVMSMNLLLPNEDDAVIWRGPLLANAVKQLWEEVAWGELDYLILDMPPGTADIPLTVMQSLPVAGAVLVTAPQELVGMVVRKAVQLTTATNKPIIGIVENMSYFECPDTKTRHEIFGPSRAEEMAKATGRPVLAKLPLDPELAKLCDQGRIEEYQSEAYSELADHFLEATQVLAAIGKMSG